MQYLLAVHSDFDAPPPEDVEAIFADVDAYNKQLADAGVLVFVGGLTPPSQALVVRTKGGKAVLQDGPFAETKEVLGGFWVVDVDDRDAAVDWACRASAACRNPVEVRPFQSE